MNISTLKQESISSIFTNNCCFLKDLKKITIHIPMPYGSEKEKIKAWDKTLPTLNLTINQEKSILKGMLEAKERKGEYC